MPFDREATPGAGAAENYYDVLGLRPGATDEEIEAAYADLAAMFAPSKVPAARQDYARKQRARLAASYAVLADPDQRAAYDNRLGGTAPAPAPATPPLAPPAPAAEIAVPVQSVPDEVHEPATADLAPLEEPNAADLPTSAEPILAQPLTIAPAPTAPLTVEPPDEGDGGLEAAPVVTRQATEQETARLAEIEVDEDAPVADDNEDELDTAEANDLVADEDELDTAEASASPPEEDLAPWQAPPAPPAPTRATPAKPVPKARPAAAPAAPPDSRPGGVALPSRREAAQIAERKPVPPAAAAPAPPARSGAPVTRPMGTTTRPTPARPAPARRAVADDGEEELLAPRSRTARPAPPPPRKRKKNTNNRLAYQIMTLVIALVLILGTGASFLSTTVTPTILDTPTPSAGAAAPLVAAGDSAGQAGQWTQAEQYFQQALQIDPQNVQATLGLAQVYMSKTPPDLQQANAYAQQVIRIAPGSTEATTARNLLAALSLTPQSTATTSGGAATTPAATPAGNTAPTPAATSPAAAPTTAATPAP
jgi:tetratricopeptide (TPR) repeat protein